LVAELIAPYRKYTRDTILAGIASVAIALKGFILLPILSKTLGAQAYGIWSQIQVTIALLTLLAVLQLGFAMTRFLAGEADKSKVGTGFFSILALTSSISIVLSTLVFVLAEPIAAAVFGGIQAASLVRLAAFLVLLATIDQMIIEYFMTLRQMGKYSIFIIAQTTSEIALIAYLVFSGFGLYGVIAALLVIRALLFLVGFFTIKSQIKPSVPSLSVIKAYLVFTLPLVPAGLYLWIYTLSDRYIIGYFLGAEAVGIYSAACILGTTLGLFFDPLAVVLLPAITYLYENGKIQEVKTHLKYSLKFYLTFSIPSVIGLSILAKPLLATLTTAEFVAGFMIVPVIALATAVLNSSAIITRVLLLFKRTGVIGLIYGAAAVINVAMNIVLVPVIGILGAAISTLAASMLVLALTSVISFKRFPFDVDRRFIVKAIVSSLIMGAVIWKLNPNGAVSILVSVIIGALTYFVILGLLRGFTREEYNLFRGFLASLKD